MGLSNTIQKWSSQRAGRNRLHPCACRRRAVRRERACSGASVMTRTVVRGAAPYSGARQPSRRSAANVEAALTLLDKKTLSTFDAVGDLVRRPRDKRAAARTCPGGSARLWPFAVYEQLLTAGVRDERAQRQ